jgi:hypothetical protein
MMNGCFFEMKPQKTTNTSKKRTVNGETGKPLVDANGRGSAGGF